MCHTHIPPTYPNELPYEFCTTFWARLLGSKSIDWPTNSINLNNTTQQGCICPFPI